MTKSHEQGENEITIEAKKIAARGNMHVCAVLADMLRKAKSFGDQAHVQKIIRAQKYLGCRNLRKRGNAS